MRMALALVLAATLMTAVAAFPSSALAQGAAGDQYTEQVPDADGSPEDVPDDGTSNPGGEGGPSPSGGSGDDPGSGGSGSGALTPSTINEFDQGGSDGSAAADLAQETAPDSAPLDEAVQQAGAGGLDSGEARGGGVFDSAQDDGGSSGMGIVLPIILGAALLAAAAYWFARRRNGRAAAGETASPHHA